MFTVSDWMDGDHAPFAKYKEQKLPIFDRIVTSQRKTPEIKNPTVSKEEVYSLIGLAALGLVVVAPIVMVGALFAFAFGLMALIGCFGALSLGAQVVLAVQCTGSLLIAITLFAAMAVPSAFLG